MPLSPVGGGTTDPASTTVAGIVELATTAEVDTGTDATRAISPDSLNGSAPALVGTNFTGVAGVVASEGAWSDFPYMQKVTLGDEADSVANPPADPITGNAFTWNNSDHLDSASITSGTLTWNHDATNTGFGTGPRLTTALPYRPGKARAIAAFIRGDVTEDVDENNETIAVVSEVTGDPATTVSQFGLRFDGGAFRGLKHFDDGAATTAGVALTAGEMQNGIWCLMVEADPGISTRVLTAYVKASDKDTLPAWDDWVYIDSTPDNQAGDPQTARDFGLQMNTANTSDDLIGYFDAAWIGYV